MAMNYEALGRPHAEEYPDGIGLVNDFVESLQSRGLLPERFPDLQQTEPGLPFVGASLSALETSIEVNRVLFSEFFGGEVKKPEVPQELIDVYSRAQEKGINTLAAYFLPEVEFKEDQEYPGWKVRPNGWYWNRIKGGRVSADAAEFSGSWVLVDTTPRPSYHGGKQQYQNDPFAQTLSELRRDGKIEAVDYVPQTSRFAVSADELQEAVNPRIAELLGVSREQVRQPKAIEFNVVGNVNHPEWGQTNTWEWMNDSFVAGRRLIGGSSLGGGLADVDDNLSDVHHDHFGFRIWVEFPSRT